MNKEDLEKAYNEASLGNSNPEIIYTNLSCLRFQADRVKPNKKILKFLKTTKTLPGKTAIVITKKTIALLK